MSEKFKSTKGWRMIQWEEDTNRLDLDGVFTAEDLRSLAMWLDDPKKPTIRPGVSVIDVKLSKM